MISGSGSLLSGSSGTFGFHMHNGFLHGLVRFIRQIGGVRCLPDIRNSLYLFGNAVLSSVGGIFFSGSESCGCSGVVSTSCFSSAAGASDSGEL